MAPKKIRIAATVDIHLVDELRVIYQRECYLTKEQDKRPPNWSAIVEMILAKGVKAYKREFSSGKA